MDSNDDRPVVITTLFPQYDFTRQITDDSVDVQYLLPPDTNAHAYDPSPQDVISILKADLFIYTGDQMEPWVESTILPSAEDQALEILNLSEHVKLIEQDHDHDEGHEEEVDGADADPHIWTDPLNEIRMVEAIETVRLDIVDEETLDTLTKNADAYIAELQAYHDDVLHVLDNSELDVTVTRNGTTRSAISSIATTSTM